MRNVILKRRSVHPSERQVAILVSIRNKYINQRNDSFSHAGPELCGVVLCDQQTMFLFAAINDVVLDGRPCWFRPAMYKLMNALFLAAGDRKDAGKRAERPAREGGEEAREAAHPPQRFQRTGPPFNPKRLEAGLFGKAISSSREAAHPPQRFQRTGCPFNRFLFFFITLTPRVE